MTARLRRRSPLPRAPPRGDGTASPDAARGDGNGVTLALGALLVAGAGLRLALMVTRGPAFLGHLDTLVYIRAAGGDLFGPPGWPVGYQLLLRLLHELVPSLTLLIAIQHLLGMATALLLFLTVRRAAPAVWGLVPAAVVLLAGPQLFLEHTPLAEAPFTFLVAACCYCTVRVLDDDGSGWAIAAGALGVVAACVRSVALALPLWGALCLMVATSGGARRRIVAGGAVILTAWLLLAAYVAVAKHEAGYVGPGLTRTGGWAFYARVAPFADCHRFTPPGRARVLCEKRPPGRRQSSRAYMLIDSPAQRAFGGWGETQPAEDQALSAFARAAIVHQPGDYLRSVGTDLTRFWSSDRHFTYLAGVNYATLFGDTVTNLPPIVEASAHWYSTGEASVPAGVPRLLRKYEAHTRLEGPLFMLLVLLALVGIPLARGRALAVGVFMAGVSVLLLVAPVVSAYFDARYVVPGYGPLAATGAIGAASLWKRVTA